LVEATVNDLGARYNRTVWVTEMDCPNASGPVEHELAFMRNVTNVRSSALADFAPALRCAGWPPAVSCIAETRCLYLHHTVVTMLRQCSNARGTTTDNTPREMTPSTRAHRSTLRC